MKQYSGNITDFEKKLKRVMDRLSVSKYQYDWTSSKTGSTVFVEMLYNGQTYRFENSKLKSAQCGRNFDTISDLFGSIVYSLEGLARAVEQDIFTLDMLLTGVPSLPAATPLEPCFEALGFTEMPKDHAELQTQYRHMVKVMHPDHGGSSEAFISLKENYAKCEEILICDMEGVSHDSKRP